MPKSFIASVSASPVDSADRKVRLHVRFRRPISQCVFALFKLTLSLVNAPGTNVIKLYGSNLLMFIRCQRVCPWEAFPAWSNV